MSLGERRLRMQRMRLQVMEHNVYRWAASVLGDLRELRMESPGVADLGRSGPVVVPNDASTERKMA
jgi:trehalose 6-phosphate synthase